MQPQYKIPEDLSDLRFRIRNSLNGQNKIKLGKFILLQILGSGNYGDVYKVVHQQNQKFFAMKIIDKQLLFIKNTNQYVRQILTRLLQTQGKLMQMCNSPHVIKCYEIMQNKQYKIFILQYCNRASLHDQLKKRKAFHVTQALAILKQIITGLAELHRNKIIHRDLKAENIMIHNGKYKIADFGFSRKIDSENKTAKFTVLGTRTTMAPQVRNQQSYGIKADIWSIGIIFYTMICSNIPFQAQGGTARSKNINDQVRKGGSLFFSTLDGLPDEQLVSFLRSMLTINQQQRISWRQLINHKIFKRCQSQIFQNPVVNVQLKQADYTVQIKQLPLQQHQEQITLSNKKSNSSQQGKNAQSQFRKQLQQTINLQINSISDFQAFKKIMKSDVDKIRYHQIQENNLQCHKSVYIYEKIVLELENKKMLDLTRKSHNQLLYLLITRCFTNISWADNNLNVNGNDETFVNYHHQINQTYKMIKAKWNEIGQRLTLVEGRLSSILLGMKDSLIAKDKKQKQYQYLGGIEKIDYTKQNQIQYTQNQYISRIVNELEGSPKDVAFMKQKLQSYKKINEITLQELEKKGLTFLERVKQIVVQP